MAASLQKVSGSTKWPESTADRRIYKPVRVYKFCCPHIKPFPVYKPTSDSWMTKTISVYKTSFAFHSGFSTKTVIVYKTLFVWKIAIL
jgi:predicted metal-binding transcription factor (methanogenesis marker protein 9)